MDSLEHIWTFITSHRSSWILIGIALVFELVARWIKNKNKKIIVSQNGDNENPEDSEFYLQYYQKNQVIDFFRVIVTIVLLISLFIINTDVGLSFFAVAAGAFVIAFRDFILSVLAFFFVTPQYQIGLTVKVGGVQGQIIFIRMLSVGVLGKDDQGENTGELFIVPSHKFITDIVEKEDLRSTSILRDEITIPYSSARFNVGFEVFVSELRKFLDDKFPLKHANNVGNYPSYAGHRYKIDFAYHDEKYVGIRIGFVGKVAENKQKKETIIAFVDTYMKSE